MRRLCSEGRRYLPAPADQCSERERTRRRGMGRALATTAVQLPQGGACSNKLLVSRRIIEKAVLTAVKERLRDPASIRYVLERVETEVQRLRAHLT
jgi:hypothetical protein